MGRVLFCWSAPDAQWRRDQGLRLHGHVFPRHLDTVGALAASPFRLGHDALRRLHDAPTPCPSLPGEQTPPWPSTHSTVRIYPCILEVQELLASHSLPRRRNHHRPRHRKQLSSSDQSNPQPTHPPQPDTATALHSSTSPWYTDCIGHTLPTQPLGAFAHSCETSCIYSIVSLDITSSAFSLFLRSSSSSSSSPSSSSSRHPTMDS